jgi:hypothetical protein
VRIPLRSTGLARAFRLQRMSSESAPVPFPARYQMPAVLRRAVVRMDPAAGHKACRVPSRLQPSALRSSPSLQQPRTSLFPPKTLFSFFSCLFPRGILLESSDVPAKFINLAQKRLNAAGADRARRGSTGTAFTREARLCDRGDMIGALCSGDLTRPDCAFS